jgi:alpha-N-arabinofuranosidase
MISSRLTLLSVALLSLALHAQQPARLAIHTDEIVTPINPSFYGLMTEEINHSYEGGLHAELISNTTFRGGWMGIEGWNQALHGGARATLSEDKSTGPSAALPYSVKISVTAAAPGDRAGISNSGYWGIALHPRTPYKGSLYAKTDRTTTTPLTVQLIDDKTGTVLASATVSLTPGSWQRYEFSLATKELVPSTHNHIEYTLGTTGTLWLQCASLFPPTFHNRPNGDRADLTERMIAMHPHFLRMPGGNYLEGDRLADWYNWKQTIGPNVDRPGHQAPWSYWSDDHFGLLEFLEWADDMKVEPLLAVYAGYALQHDRIKPGKDLEPFVQSALDEVEYLTGDLTTKWGAERAQNGHPAPFTLHYIEIGNEDWFDTSGSYDARFAQFAEALRKKYPQYKLIATTPVKVKPGLEPDLVDDHYYKSPADMFALVHQYDKVPRPLDSKAPKIFVGEWATRSGSPTPNFGDALGDAAWMTAMERNGDLIQMAAYAPLLVNVNPGAMQWSTDLIGFDGLTTYGSPSYYAQCLFAEHLGDGTPRSFIEGLTNPDRFFYSASISSATHTLHIKLVNATDKPQPLYLALEGATPTPHLAKMFSLHGATFAATNSITQPEFIKPVASMLHVAGTSLAHTVPALTIEVIDIPLQ